jgi:hypothetical protein
MPPDRVDVLQRALARAREAGASAVLAADGPPLVLPIRRLSTDAELRARLADAAYEWSQRHPPRS